ncbi:ATP-binding protein [Streptomyces sp. NPDC053750]|uniref:ATP-binding protein n=1 Tax=Streptomyces sp. NPDC053750 TaxID=3365714 RepID=UPI0037CD7D7D
MKQSAVKTLGVAALGAAFAVAGAGAANAAPTAQGSVKALDQVTRTLPTGNVSQVVPTAGDTLEQAPTDQVTGLLGGVPAKGLPANVAEVNGVPLG